MKAVKTQKTEASVIDFLNAVADERRRQDGFALLGLMREATGLEPKMWGGSIIGFGDLHVKSESGREVDWFPVGFSPRKQNLVFYVHGGFSEYESLLGRLGKHKAGAGCLYINRLSDVDTGVLKEIARRASSKKN